MKTNTKLILKGLFLLSICNLSFAESIIPCGWGVMNLHEKNSNLVGFSIKQQPDSENSNYIEAHPYAVAFVFNSGPAHLVYYSPSGQVLGGDWEVVDNGHWGLQNLQPVESMYHECRGTNLSYKPNKVNQSGTP